MTKGVKSDFYITDDYGATHIYADTAFVTEFSTHSKVLGPDGNPLVYDRPKVGFDLRRK